MKVIKTLCIAIFAITLISCANPPSEEEVVFHQLLEEVLEVHDEMMPQMGELSDLRQQLEEKASEEPMDAINYEDAIAQLEAAHKGMMDWMKDFGEVFPYKENRLEGMNEVEIKESVELMKDQKVKVDNMKNDMVESMQNAKSILGN